MKNFKNNSSFITNQQLIQGIRNKSSKHISRNRSVQSNISLIEPKSYHRDSSKVFNTSTSNKSLANIQNINPNAAHNVERPSKESSSLIKFLKDNISNKSILNHAEKLIEQIPDSCHSEGMSKQEAALMAKIEQLYLDKNKLKKEKRALQDKVKKQRMESELKQEMLHKENERLHKIILKQSEMISNQKPHQKEGQQELRRMLLTQAKSIQYFQLTQSKPKLALSRPSSFLKNR